MYEDDNLNYDKLKKIGFSSKLVNQILILNKYCPSGTILDYINKDVNPELIRSLNNFLKQNERSNVQIENLLYFIEYNEDPMIFEEEENTLKYNFIKNLLKDKINKKSSDLNYNEVIKIIKNTNFDNRLLRFIYEDYTDNKNISKYLRNEFNNEETNFARYLTNLGFECFVNEIPKIEKSKDLSKYCFTSDELLAIQYNKLNFVKIINNYENSEILSIIELANKSNICKYINKYDGINIYLYEELHKRKIDDNLIDTYLKESSYKFRKYQKSIINKFIDLKMNNYEVEKYFTDVPTIKEMELLELFTDYDYSYNEIAQYLELFKKHLKCNDLLCDVDYLKYIELYEEGYDVSNLIEHQVTADVIDYTQKLCNKNKLQNNNLFNPTFRSNEILLLRTCKHYNRDDVACCVLNCKYSDNDNNYFIRKIIEKDDKNGTHTNIVNIYYDKGNDIFKDYNPDYEFNNEQKKILIMITLSGKIDNKQLDLIRNNHINADVMRQVCDMIYKGQDINFLLPKIEELTKEDIITIKECIKLGFTIIPNNENKER